MKAVSDAGPTEPNSVKPEPIANLFTMMEIRLRERTYDFFNEKIQQLRDPLRRYEKAVGRGYQ